MAIRCIVFLAVCISISTTAAADGFRALARDTGRRISPIRAARVVRTLAGQVQIVGPWHTFEGAATRTNFVPVFDCLNGASLLATDENLPFWSNDITVSPEHAGLQATRVSFAWVWGGDGNGNDAPCIIAVSTFEGFRGCDDPAPSAGDTFIDGVMYDFGLLPASPFYQLAEIDLSGTGLSHTMPAAGTGAIQMVMFDQVEPELLLARAAFPVYSNTGDDDEPPTPRPGTQGPYEFDDNSPTDAFLDVIDECYDHSSPTPPYEIGPAIIFSVKSGCACPGDVDDYGDVTLQDLALLLAAFGESGPFDYPCVDVDRDGTVGLTDLAILLSHFGVPC